MPRKERPTEYQQHLLFELEGQAVPEKIKLRRLQEGLAPYIDTQKLRRLVIEKQDVYQSLRSPSPPKEVRALLDTLVAVLQPHEREQIKSPADVAGMFMVSLGSSDQEELHTVLLNTKGRVQKTVMVYRGSLDTAVVRVGEVYKEAIRKNSASIIVVHNHPSSNPEPSPEDIIITHQIVLAGQILSIACLDHIVVGRSSWVSLKERGLMKDLPKA